MAAEILSPLGRDDTAAFTSVEAKDKLFPSGYTEASTSIWTNPSFNINSSSN